MSVAARGRLNSRPGPLPRQGGRWRACSPGQFAQREAPAPGRVLLGEQLQSSGDVQLVGQRGVGQLAHTERVAAEEQEGLGNQLAELSGVLDLRGIARSPLRRRQWRPARRARGRGSPRSTRSAPGGFAAL